MSAAKKLSVDGGAIPVNDSSSISGSYGHTENSADNVSEACSECADTKHAESAEEQASACKDGNEAADDEKGNAADEGTRDECRAACHQQIRDYWNCSAERESHK